MTVDSILYTSGALSNISTTDDGLLFEQNSPTDPVSRFINTQQALFKGFQPLFYTLNDPAINSAFDLLSQLTALGVAITGIQGLDQNTGIYHSAFFDLDNQGITGDDFELTENQAVLARIKTDKTLSISGPVYCHSIDLNAGVNIIGFNCLANNFSAFQLLTAIGDQNVIASIQKFNSVTGRFETASYQDGNTIGSDFVIKIGEAYFLHMLTDVAGLNLLNIEKSVTPEF